MGLLDWLSPALTVGTTAMAAQRNAQANTIATQQAQAAAQVKAYMDRRKAEDEHAKSMAETMNQQNQQANELARIDATARGQGTNQLNLENQKNLIAARNGMQTFMQENPEDPLTKQIQAEVVGAGGQWTPDIINKYGGVSKIVEHRFTHGEDVYKETQATGRTHDVIAGENQRNTATIGGAMARQTASDAAALERARIAAGGKKAGTTLPVTATNDLAKVNAMISAAQGISDQLDKITKEGTNVSGRVFGVIPEPDWVANMRGKGGDVGTDYRAQIGNLFGTVAKERGGTALSESEIRILQTYVPNTNDSEDRALIKAKRFVTELKRMKAAKLQTFREAGFGAGGAAPPASDDADAEAEAIMRQHQKTP